MPLPPVSAISGIGLPSRPRRRASVFWIERAASVDPVKTTPATEGLETRRAPTRPSPGTSCSVPAGKPLPRNSFTACAAISGVSSAGLAITALPAARAAATWPVKIDSGKFHGLMQATTPSGLCVSFDQPRACEA